MLQTGAWDVLIGHMLGMDHAGHTFGVQSPEMLAKIQQNDADVVQVWCVYIQTLYACASSKTLTYQ